ncbi:MAG: hypothetical protein OEZ21_03205 [Candidatus Bathyarchaeota archaeon]|nr:hypothetical protein [Candidatus Bathyarchaeota archaeon]MDH5745953.1 hypothetical protein [Candidatus Bathyarchaeota archaeon]
MKRITTTLFGIFAIIVILFTMAQAGNMGVPWLFNLAAVVMIIVVIISVVRVWLRGF